MTLNISIKAKVMKLADTAIVMNLLNLRKICAFTRGSEVLGLLGCLVSRLKTFSKSSDEKES